MKNATFNPQDQTVTFQDMFDDTQTISYLEAYARGFVIQHLSWKGTYKSVLTEVQWEQAYLMCDGFPGINREFATEQCWDWSHVRDSSYETMVKVADWIASQKWHLKSIHTIVDDMIKQCDRVGLDPVQAIP